MQGEILNLMGASVLNDEKEKADLLMKELEMREHPIYIHYGHKEFDKEQFQEIKNWHFRNKPIGGLWASPVNAEYGWKEWNKSNEFVPIEENNSFKFTLSPAANILVISSVDDIDKLPSQTYDDPSLTYLAKLTEMTGSKSIDFETIKNNGYDAVELKFSEDTGLYMTMYGWDCDSIVILNPDIVEPILEKEKEKNIVFDANSR
jgi:hypothetical protein